MVSGTTRESLSTTIDGMKRLGDIVSICNVPSYQFRLCWAIDIVLYYPVMLHVFKTRHVDTAHPSEDQKPLRSLGSASSAIW